MLDDPEPFAVLDFGLIQLEEKTLVAKYRQLTDIENIKTSTQKGSVDDLTKPPDLEGKKPLFDE